MLIQFICTLVYYANNGDKFYCKKFMQVADEKLIINELVSYQKPGLSSRASVWCTKICSCQILQVIVSRITKSVITSKVYIENR